MAEILITDKILFEKGQALIKAAYDYWEHYNEVADLVPSAVVHLTTESGAMILFTRGEYKQQIMSNIGNIGPEKYFDETLFLNEKLE